jgi:hypothetical protein
MVRYQVELSGSKHTSLPVMLVRTRKGVIDSKTPDMCSVKFEEEIQGERINT